MLPTIIFISAFFAVLYHIGLMQIIIRGMAWVMLKTMRISGAESMNVAASIFMGQTEAPLTIRPFLSRATRSELMVIMTSGMAHVSGGIMAMYISQGIEARHLLSAVIMTSPGTILMAKMLVPETEVPATEGRVVIPKDEMHKEENLIGAIARGTIDGGKLAMNVAIMLISFLALVALLDSAASLDPRPGLHALGSRLASARFSATSSRPSHGSSASRWHDCLAIGNLLGTRMALNEVIAYIALGAQKATLAPRSFTIATFALMRIRQPRLHRHADRRHRRISPRAPQRLSQVRRPRHASRHHGQLDLRLHRRHVPRVDAGPHSKRWGAPSSRRLCFCG